MKLIIVKIVENKKNTKIVKSVKIIRKYSKIFKSQVPKAREKSDEMKGIGLANSQRSSSGK